MSTPTKAEIFAQIALVAKIRDVIFQAGGLAADNIVDLEDQLNQALEGNRSSQIASGVNTVRGSMVTAMSGTGSPLRSLIHELAESGYGININGLSDTEIFREIRKAMKAVPETIASRGITRGSVAPGASNVGVAEIYRTTLDANGQDIETHEPGTVKIQVIDDKNNTSITPGNEKIRMFLAGPNKVDALELRGGPDTTKVTNLQVANSQLGLLKNPSFDAIEPAISKVEQEGWRLSATTGFRKIANPEDIFRYSRGQERVVNPIGYALEISQNRSLAQYFARSGARINKNLPHFLVLRYMRKNSCDGTLTLSLGSVSVTKDLNTAANDTWETLVIGADSADGWFKNFDQDWLDPTATPPLRLGVQVKIELAGRSAGELIIDEIIFREGTFFNGAYYLMLAGQADKDVLVDDEWTFTDVYTSGNYEGKIQEAISKELNDYLPHTAVGGETYSDV